jgi:2Fe-2S ferredoxin
MAKIHFVDHTGETRIIDVENGATVMEAAIRNAVPGIEAECGGACACATCHVYVDEAWRGKVGAPSPMEEDMLDFGFDVAVLPDQGHRRTRRSGGRNAGAAGLSQPSSPRGSLSRRLTPDPFRAASRAQNSG